MKQKFLVKGKNFKGEEVKFSPAEMHLASLLRTLKSSYDKKDKSAFFKHMMAESDGKSFSKAEVIRLWKAMHKVAYWNADFQKYIIPMSADHNLYFPREYYRNNSNFFESYAKQLLEEGEILVHRGRPKGYSNPTMTKVLANPTKEDISSTVEACLQAVADQSAKVAALSEQLKQEEETLVKLQAKLKAASYEQSLAKKREFFATLSQMVKEEGYDLKELVESCTK